MEQLTRGYVEISYGLPLTVDKVFRVGKVGVYPMSRYTRFIINQEIPPQIVVIYAKYTPPID